MSRAQLLLLVLLALGKVGLADDRPVNYAPSPTYGPSQANADLEVAAASCHEAHFQNDEAVANALRSGDTDQILQVIAEALDVWRATSETSALYPARTFCIHELVPRYLQGTDVPGHDSDEARQPTPTVRQFQQLGISYWYYVYDGDWVLENPVDLMDFAMKHLNSRWGREAFLMMTKLGWSLGNCHEGADYQFREVIRRGEEFLKTYPESETSNSIRFEVASAYATWWTLSASPTPERYKQGGETARERAIELYQQYIEHQKAPNRYVENDVKALQARRPFRQIDYHCEDYED